MEERNELDPEYCITLDNVPEGFYEEIAGNAEQIQEWRKLYHLSQKEQLNLEFMRDNPSLMVDTKYFSEEFKNQLLGSYTRLESMVEGILIHSENLTALSALQEEYHGKIKCVYIDPPYNTGGKEFVYKDKYAHSTWLKMMRKRLEAAKDLLSEEGVYFVSIDDNELARLTLLAEEIFDNGALIGPIIVQTNPGGRDYLHIARTHEYIVVGLKDKEKGKTNEIKKTDVNFRYEDSRGGWNPRGLRNRNPKFNRTNRPNLFYPIYVNPATADPNGHAAVSLENSEEYSIKILPRNSKGVDDCWRWGKEKLEQNIKGNSPDKSNVIAYQKRDGKWRVMEKNRRTKTKVKSIWQDSGLRTEDGTRRVRSIFGNTVYDHPKPVELVKKCILLGAGKEDLILDYFAGSGTTGEAVLELNRADRGRRKYILIEQGEYFDTVLKPRIQKLVYSSQWKDGVPLTNDGLSHIFKYHKLESAPLKEDGTE